MVERPDVELHVPSAGSDLDGLDYLVGRSMHDINLKAYSATASAHREGGVPVLTLWVDSLSAEAIGQVIYFFEHSVAIGGYLLGVNPFDQPGVEAYKKKMFSLLGRPGK
jgi:glucose-6-phosphate isomerase